ncbi:MAG: hypothetical protein JO341_06830 [Gammaproteobacteria bacterium]|nr:hypothetical protein [Gammaproteobacteria bacterium]MBV9620725.1 hypothetical protein [Gammaproteobacteria bacterium]
METFFRGEAVMAQRSVVLDQLERTEREIKQCEALLARQRSLPSTGGAKNRTLRQLEEAQIAYIANRERLRAEFAALDGSESDYEF